MMGQPADDMAVDDRHGKRGRDEDQPGLQQPGGADVISDLKLPCLTGDVGRSSLDYTLDSPRCGSSSADAQARDPQALPISFNSKLMSMPTPRSASPLNMLPGLDTEVRTPGLDTDVQTGEHLILSPDVLYSMADLSEEDLSSLPAAADEPSCSTMPFMQPAAPSHAPSLFATDLTALPLTRTGLSMEAGAMTIDSAADRQPAAAPAARSHGSWDWLGRFPKPPCAAPSEPFLLKHKRWQESLRAALYDADGYTRSLLGAATALSPCGTLEVLAGLSPRQVSTLHPPARELVQGLLDRTRAQASRLDPMFAAAFAPTPAPLTTLG